jgi:hypothetical protein
MSTPPVIEVFIYSNQDAKNVESVMRIFNGSSSTGLTVSVNVVPLPDAKGWDADYAMVVDAFKKAQPNSYVIICKDTAVSALTSQTVLDVLERVIQSGLDPANAFDIFYLSKWLDRCDHYTNVRQIGDRGLKLVDTISPNGVLCLMFSPAGRAKFLTSFPPVDSGDIKANPITDRPLGQVLNSRIESRTSPSATDPTRPVGTQRFIASTTDINLVEFDISKRANENEMLKTTRCRAVSPTPLQQKARTGPSMGFFWFILIAVIVIILGWALIKIGSRFSMAAKQSDLTRIAGGGMPGTVSDVQG